KLLPFLFQDKLIPPHFSPADQIHIYLNTPAPFLIDARESPHRRRLHLKPRWIRKDQCLLAPPPPHSVLVDPAPVARQKAMHSGRPHSILSSHSAHRYKVFSIVSFLMLPPS